MEVMEKPKTRKKREKHKKSDYSKDKDGTGNNEPIACSSKNVDVSKELANAANDIEFDNAKRTNNEVSVVCWELASAATDIEFDNTESTHKEVTEEVQVFREEKQTDNKIQNDCTIICSPESVPDNEVSDNIEVQDPVACDTTNVDETMETPNSAEMECNTSKAVDQVDAIEKERPITKTENVKTNVKYHKEKIPEYNYAELNNQLKKVTLAEESSEMKPKIVESNKIVIKAYTENQLSALYTNTELNAIEQFTAEFLEAELKGFAIKNHPLFELLLSYLQVKNKVMGNNLELKQLRSDYNELQNQLWTLNSSVVSERGQCLDGITVTATHTFTKATFHRSVFQSLIRTLNKIREVANESHTLYSYSAEVLKFQIQLYISNVVNNILNITQLPQKAPIHLGMEAPPQHLLPYLSDLRLCISVLFKFQRKLIRDPEFIKETRQWLSQLVFLLLRLASWQDHLFILNHVLRCPPGIGNWASQFIQVPFTRFHDNPFANYEINHAVVTLALILMPVTKRQEFLEEISQQKDAPVEALWVMVDSEGEEDEETCGTSLRENDLVALLNQLPLDNLFRAVLLIEKHNNKDVYDPSKTSEHHILRFFSFSTLCLKLIHRGLKTYGQPRYYQFCKRLSRFIRHIVQYATDQWELFQINQKIVDTAMIERLQVEYDAFFLRAIYYLYTSEKLGAWQFLAVIPYGIVSKQTLWKIFYFLHEPNASVEEIIDTRSELNYEEKMGEFALNEQFEEKLSSLAEDECYYLLNTFANMALARKEEDMKFIFAATMDLLRIGFLSEKYHEMWAKNAAILLSHITSKYPHLLSDILHLVKENIVKMENMCILLYDTLPVSIWKPKEEDIDLFSKWLLQTTVETEAKLARMIISRLNWDLVDEGVPFLPYSLHCKMATILVKAVQVNQNHQNWAWKVAFALKLHIMDRAFSNFQQIKDIDHFDIIYKGLRDQQPIAAFLSVLISSWGHLVPLVCSKGLDQLLFLQTHQKYEAVLFALNLIVPLFIECQESIINLDKFQNILMGLLNPNRSYIEIVSLSTNNSVLHQFGNMIDSQITNFKWYGLQSPRYLVRLWVNSLVSIPNWNKDYGVMYLLDVIIKASIYHADTMDVIGNILKDLLQCVTPQEQSSSIGSLFKWVSQSPQNNLLINTSLSTSPYLAYVMISLEFEEREKSTGLWNEILVQLKNQKGKVNVDLAIKKASSKLKVQSFSSGSLSIFRWAQQALDTPIEHPILVLFWQKFFCLYLYRVPVIGTTDRGCVGEKFFEGVINFNFLKRMKRRLQETVDYYKSQTTQSDFQHLPPAKQLYYMSALKVFVAYSLWLEEPRLQEATLYLPGLPPQYEPQLLNLVMQFSEAPWLEYVDYGAIKELQKQSVDSWNIANGRVRRTFNLPIMNAGSSIESSDPWERIVRRLASYDNPKEAPPIIKNNSIIPPLNLVDKKAMFLTLEGYFKKLLQFAKNNTINVSDFKALDCGYQDLIPQLYRSVLNKISKSVPCSGGKGLDCCGAATIVLKLQEARINDHIEQQIQLNRRDYEDFLSRILMEPSHSLCFSAVILHHVILILQKQKITNPETSELGVELFYHILSLMNEETSSYLPTKKLFSECLEKLGQSHINGVEFETPRLLNKILEDPALGMFLAPHFSPVQVGTANFLLMYSMITKGIGKQYDVLYSLLSKFDVNNWLQTKKPKLSQRSQFIELVMQALIRLGQDPPTESLVLHEVYRKHLLCVFQYQFPEHYGEILMHILKASNGVDSDCVAISVWLDILNCLANPIHWELNGQLRDNLRQYAQQQQVLHYQELLDNAMLLSRHFTTERLQYGLYGLYPKTRNYIDVIVLFLGMSGHSLIISALNTHQGILGDKLCEIIWPYLRDMFAPWVMPYWTNNLKENMATWIQQLTDDRSVLLPWIPANAPFAQKVVNMFFECILFIIQTLPACNNILSFVWHWYVTNFTHTVVKDHVLNVIHHSFISLPWQKFWPSISDLELMLKVSEQYLPESHTFLGHIFMEVPWRTWLYSLSENTNIQIRIRVHHCLLNLLVRLSNEPNIRNNCADKTKALLVQAEGFDWTILEISSVQQAIDWYVMSCDPLVLFKTDPLMLDCRLMQFLKVVCFYNKPLSHPDSTIQEKRYIFIKGFLKIISVFMNKNKKTFSTREVDLINIIKSQLNHMENIVHLQCEMNIILGEILTVLNHLSNKSNMLQCLEQWMAGREGDGMIVKAVLEVLGSSVGDPECVAILYETCINTYFTNNVQSLDNWDEIYKVMKWSFPKQNILIDEVIGKGCILTLHAVLLQKMSANHDISTLINIALNWLSNIKVNDTNEDKVPLIWADIMDIAFNYAVIEESSAAASLYKFVQCLLKMSEQKEVAKWGGLLGAIGIGKQSAVTLQFRFLCKAVASYIMAQLPDTKGNPQKIRLEANAAGTVGQPGGNSEVAKVLLKLDFGQSQGKIKECAEQALKQIQDPQNSFHNAKAFLSKLLLQLYTKPYLKNIS